jgi:hypothetical protein
MMSRSYSANESINRRISRPDGSSDSVPSPAADTTRAPRLDTSRSIKATSITSRPSLSRFATIRTSPRFNADTASIRTGTDHRASGANHLALRRSQKDPQRSDRDRKAFQPACNRGMG